MKIGVNRWTLPGDWPLSRCFQEAAAAGFDTIEVNIAEDGEIALSSGEASIRALPALAKAAGIEISSLSTGLGWKYPLSAGTESDRERAVDVIRRQLETAAWLGVDTILVVPAVVTPEVSYDAAWSRALEGLKRLAADAERLGVHIGVENVWNKFLLSPLEFAGFVDAVGSDHVGAYFDAGNVLVYGYPQHWIRILGSRIRKVHVKDFRTGIGNIGGFCNPLQGDVPWQAVNSALREVGYAGPVTAEVDGYRVHPELGLRHIAESLRSCFAN
ncbi:MAG: sugar phosphate isomerase/epimerase [Armatimonadetes bacterium]|nr:sugar phosphate isomerase/epimerase [Armatimonadota bacterium]MDE2207028.1 sugar phosphate isomerase/epimerase [Armatimonadota bacterium]